MDFDQFLEKGILSFLDGKIEHKRKGAVDREEEYGLYLTKDYMKELRASLDNDELTKAKRLFDELKQTYNNLPKNSLERKKIYTLLEQMYSKIEAYVQMRTRSSPGAPIPLIVSQAVESEGHGNKLDVQSSIMESQIGHFDKKASTIEKSSEPLTGLEERDNNSVDSGIYSNKKKISNSAYKEERRDDLKELSIDNIAKNLRNHLDIKIEVKKFGEHKDDSHDKSQYKSPDKPLGLYKIPKKLAKDTSKEQESALHKEGSMIESSKELSDDKSEILKQMSISMNKIDAGSEDITLYKVPHADMHKLKSKDPIRTADTGKADVENSSDNKKIESYKIMRERHHEKTSEKTQELVFSELDKAKHLEGLAHIEKMYFEGIYLFYNHNYHEASKLFEKVLDARPRSKAAKIRLHECMEAMESE